MPPSRFSPAHAIVAALLLALSVAAPAQSRMGFAEGYSDPYLPTSILSMVSFDDGSGAALYVGGAFTTIGGMPALNIAKWNGHAWVQVGQGFNQAVRSVCVATIGGTTSLYAGGDFTSSGATALGRVARWTGSAWVAVGGTAGDGWCTSLAAGTLGGVATLFAGGGFSQIGGVAAQHVARWNGTAWSALGSGVDYTVTCLALATVAGTTSLFAGGLFSNAGGVPASYIARWSGTTWSALAGGCSGYVTTLAAFNDGTGTALCVGGYFTAVGPNLAAAYIARWNGAAWSALGSGMNSSVSSLAVFNDGSGSALYAAGNFSQAGGVGALGVARWTGTQWQPTAGGPSSGAATVLAAFDDGGGPGLFAGGNGIARWRGGAWTASQGVYAYTVNSMIVADLGSGPALIVGGVSLQRAGATTVHSIAQRTAAGWSAMGGGVDAPVYATTVFDDGAGTALYVGGDFSQAGGGTSPAVAARGLARWNGTTWSPVGATFTGSGGSVRALAAFDDGTGPALYVGGDMTASGATPVRSIARWNGSTMSAVGPISPNSGGTVYTLLGFTDGNGPALYAGGNISAIGGVTATNVAKWNGSTWSALGNGLSGGNYSTVVAALASFDAGAGPALYAAGNFLASGPQPVSNIAVWDGGSWLPVGGGLGGSVGSIGTVMAVFDDDGPGPSRPALYVGGSFTTAGAGAASNVARWDGVAWSSLGSGVDGGVASLMVYDADGSATGLPSLLLGGSFFVAGGKSSSGLAEWKNIGPSFVSVPATAPVGQPLGFALHSDLGAQVYVLDVSVTGSVPGITLPGGIHIPLNAPLLNLDYGAALPGVFDNFIGVLGTDGEAFATANIPADPSLVGFVLSSSFVTIDSSAPSSIGSVAAAPGQTTLVPALPGVSAVMPLTGPANGGTTVIITGAYFQAGATVRFGATPATGVIVGPSSISCVTPAGVVGTVDVTVINPGNAIGTLTGGFTYVTPLTISLISPHSAIGGATISVTGTGFQPGMTVTCDGLPVVPSALTSTSFTFVRPAVIACNTTIQLTNPDSQTATAPFNQTPTITSTFGANGSTTGGNTFVIAGTNFFAGTTVTIGRAASPMVTINGTTSLLVTAPPGAVGTAQVVVSSLGGCVATTTYVYH